jgi:tetratricopeptide (TPR) repeat protein
MLCDAYLQLGQVKMAALADPSDTASVESALDDLDAGLAICADSQALSAQLDLANRFLLAVAAQSSEDFDTVVQELAPVVAAKPDYANDHARHMLYVGLVKRGDIRYESGDLDGALEDYQQALALGEPDSLDAASRLSTALGKLVSERPSAIPQTDEVPTRPDYRFAAPNLIGPPNDALFRGEYTIIILEWESVGELAGDEYYDVTVMHFVGGEPRYWGGPVRGTQWQVPVEVGLGEAANDRFYWWVTVRRAHTAPGPDQLDRALSPPSDARTFYWAE